MKTLIVDSNSIFAVELDGRGKVVAASYDVPHERFLVYIDNPEGLAEYIDRIPVHASRADLFNGDLRKIRWQPYTLHRAPPGYEHD